MNQTVLGLVLIAIGIAICGMSGSYPAYSQWKCIVDGIGWIPILLGLWIISVKIGNGLIDNPVSR
jgi:hypothetical protein